MELTIFGLGCKIDSLLLKVMRDDKKCVKCEKRLASTDILLLESLILLPLSNMFFLLSIPIVLPSAFSIKSCNTSALWSLFSCAFFCTSSLVISLGDFFSMRCSVLLYPSTMSFTACIMLFVSFSFFYIFPAYLLWFL